MQMEGKLMQFRSDVTVKEINVMSGDAGVIAAARVSTTGYDSVQELKHDPVEAAGLVTRGDNSR